jgi:hypothetical protein
MSSISKRNAVVLILGSLFVFSENASALKQSKNFEFKMQMQGDDAVAAQLNSTISQTNSTVPVAGSVK